MLAEIIGVVLTQAQARAQADIPKLTVQRARDFVEFASKVGNGKPTSILRASPAIVETFPQEEINWIVRWGTEIRFLYRKGRWAEFNARYPESTGARASPDHMKARAVATAQRVTKREWLLKVVEDWGSYVKYEFAAAVEGIPIASHLAVSLDPWGRVTELSIGTARLPTIPKNLKVQVSAEQAEVNSALAAFRQCRLTRLFPQKSPELMISPLLGAWAGSEMSPGEFRTHTKDKGYFQYETHFRDPVFAPPYKITIRVDPGSGKVLEIFDETVLVSSRRPLDKFELKGPLRATRIGTRQVVISEAMTLTPTLRPRVFYALGEAVVWTELGLIFLELGGARICRVPKADDDNCYFVLPEAIWNRLMPLS